MRQLFAALAVAVAGFAVAQDKKPKLGVGDAAPPLGVTEWLQGEEVKAFDKDKVYVVEFWATWCGPCIRAMPHLNELHDEYKDKGLVIIGLSSKDPSNSQKAVADFVARNAKRFTYRFAFCDHRDTYAAYMHAAGEEGIPCSFVVGKDGKIAWIGHPVDLGDVLPLVLAGKWEGKKSADALVAAKREFKQIVAAPEDDPAKKAAALSALVGKYPEYATHDLLLVHRLMATVRAGQFDDAKGQAEGMIALAEKRKKATPAAFAGMILAEEKLNPDRKHLDLAVKAMELAVKLDPSDTSTVLSAMDVYLAAGKRELAEAAGKVALSSVAGKGAKIKAEVEKAVTEKLAGEKK